jgi:hypothetical protein
MRDGTKVTVYLNTEHRYSASRLVGTLLVPWSGEGPVVMLSADDRELAVPQRSVLYVSERKEDE